MQIKRNGEKGREAAALVATAFVLLGGLLATVMMIVTFAADPKKPLFLAGGYLAVIGILLWLFRPRLHNNTASRISVWKNRRKEKQPELRYEPLRQRENSSDARGSNQPPSAEAIQKLRDGLRNWVPSDRRRM